MKKLTAFIATFVLMLPIFSAYAQSEEWIQVYFNMPADHSVATNNNLSNSNYDLIGTLEQLIDSATTSVDFCIYDFEHPRIAHAPGSC